MRLISYGKEITKGDNILHIYKYALIKGNHYYEKEYVDTIYQNIDKIALEGIYRDLEYICGDINLLDVSKDSCIMCGSKDELKDITIKNNKFKICSCCSKDKVSPKEFYYTEFLANLNNLYELIEFTTSNEIMLYTSKTRDKSLKTIKTKLGDISIDFKCNIFYINKN